MFRTAMTVGSFDPELDAAINGERKRQEDHIELIASENYASPRVLGTGGGGYNRINLAQAWSGVVQGLLE